MSKRYRLILHLFVQFFTFLSSYYQMKPYHLNFFQTMFLVKKHRKTMFFDYS